MYASVVCCSPLQPDMLSTNIGIKIRYIDKNDDDKNNDDNNVDSDDMGDPAADECLLFFSTKTSRPKACAKKEKRYGGAFKRPPYRFLHIPDFFTFGISSRQ